MSNTLTENQKILWDNMPDETKKVFKTIPFEHQYEAFEQCKDQEFFALFPDMGTGKSKIAVDISSYLYLKKEIDVVLVIAPNNLHVDWAKYHYALHCKVPHKTWIWNAAKKDRRYYADRMNDFLYNKDPNNLRIFCVNVETFQSESIISYVAHFVKHNNPFIIIDEATSIKTPTAKRSKIIHKLNKYGRRCILTGTPTTKSPFALWSMFEFLKENFFDCNFFVFQHRHGVMIKQINDFTNKPYHTLIDRKTYEKVKGNIKHLEVKRNGKLMPDDYLEIAVIHGLSEKNVRFIQIAAGFARFKRLDELKEKIKPYSFAIKKEDCFDLPKKIHSETLIDLPAGHMKVYKQIQKELLATYAGKTLTVMHKMTALLRLMQVAGGFFPYTEDEYMKKQLKPAQIMIGKKNPKVEALMLELDEIGDNQFLVWAVFKSELEYLYEILNKDFETCLFYGKTNASTRETYKKDFKKGKYQAMVINPLVGAKGLNLQHVSYNFLFSKNFHTENQIQLEDRTHRSGTVKSPYYKSIIAKGTVDERVSTIIKEGKDLNDYFSSSSLEQLIRG